MLSSPIARLAFLLAIVALVFTSVLAGVYAVQIGHLRDQVRELECRHVMYEDGSTTHADGERVVKCAPMLLARYGG
jgi:hypothetical protein